MKCTFYDLGNGDVAIVCGRGRTPAPCQVCGKRPHVSLCDFPLQNGKTCDRKLCGSCRRAWLETLKLQPIARDPSVDRYELCPGHFEFAKLFDEVTDENIAAFKARSRK